MTDETVDPPRAGQNRVKDKLYVLFSVDGESVNEKWRARGADHDYGGILVGTPGLEELLDELNMPCTWFIETSHDPRRDLPSRFPAIVKRIAARSRDEVGLHVHWRRSERDNRPVYETRDVAWVKSQVEQGVNSLSSCGIEPKSFRGGSFLHVARLPQVLMDASFKNDSTVLWDRCHRLNEAATAKMSEPMLGRVASRLCRFGGRLPHPYFTCLDDVELGGDSSILEFPVFYNPLELTSPWRKLLHRIIVTRAALGSRPRFVSLFLHIDELTLANSGRDEKCQVDEGALHRLGMTLGTLASRSNVAFVTLLQARAMLQGRLR